MCQNGSVCTFANKNGSFVECSCASGFTGKYCNETINECVTNPCLNGNCTNLISGFRCDCEKG